MRRIAKLLFFTLAGALGAAVFLLAVVLLGANTQPGREVLGWLVPRLTGGEVRVEGLSGSFPSALRLRALTLADGSGPYLTGSDVALDWQPLRLLHGEIAVDRLTAAEIDLLRLPKESGKSSSKPTPLLVRSFAIARLELPASLAGAAASLAVSGSLAEGADGTQSLSLDARRLGHGGGTYRVSARLTPSDVALDANLSEPPKGLLSSLAGLPDLGAIRLNASLSGPRSAIATRVALTAGPLSANARGTIDLARHAADLAVDATAPAMQPRPGISWQGVSLHARLAGPFATPTLAGNLTIENLAAAGAGIARIEAALRGNEGTAHLAATLSGILLPGPAPTLLAAAPLTVTAEANLAAPGRPVSFTLRHPLIAASGTVQTEGEQKLAATIALPDISPLAALGGIALSGQASLKIDAARQPAGLALDLAGGLALTAGMAPLPALLGPAPHVSLAARLANGTVTLRHLALSGAALSFGASGTASPERVALAWNSSLQNLSALTAGVTGALAAKGRIDGPTDALALTADLTATLGAANLPPAPVHAHLGVHGLPAAPSAQLTAEGTIAGAPLRLALSAARSPTALTLAIHEADWKSAHAEGTLALARAGGPSGKLSFSIKNLSDFSQLLSSPLHGSLAGSLAAASAHRLTLNLTGESLAASGASVGRAILAASLLDPLGVRRLEARLALANIAAGGISGASATLSAAGPMNALAFSLAAAGPDHASLAATATLDPASSQARLSALTASWHGAALRLLGPAQIVYSPGITLGNLRFAMAGAELSANGSLEPHLALSLAARNLTPALLAPFAPDLHAKFRLDADAALSGTLAAPAGRLAIRGTGIGLASGLAAGLPPASLDATANLAGRSARIASTLSAGTGTRLALSGTIPLAATGALDLAARGAIDLDILNPLLAAEGRHVAGTLTLDGHVTGNLGKPALAGTVRLANATLADYANGVSLRDISGEIIAAGETLRVARLDAHAGPGAIAISGSIGAFAPNLPVDLAITARNAELPQSDLMTARFDSDLTITGEAERRLAARGTVRLRRAEIRIPDHMPPDIPVLNVIRAGAKPPPPPAPGPNVALDITVSAAREIFVRGRGIDTEFGGKIHIGGTAAAPLPEGAFTLVRGQVSMAGKTLTFTSGTIGFNGGSPENPTLDLVATNTTSSTTATLTLGGTAEHPTVTLSSSPELPQDQILAALLFGSSSSSLSPFQIAELANSLTTLTGVGPSTGDPLGALRNGLGLDQLSVGSSASGSPTLQVGRYLAPGVYLGASQPASGGGSQAQVQINITKEIQLNATVGGTATNATGANTTSGTSVGITYQFQYLRRSAGSSRTEAAITTTISVPTTPGNNAAVVRCVASHTAPPRKGTRKLVA